MSFAPKIAIQKYININVIQKNQMWPSEELEYSESYAKMDGMDYRWGGGEGGSWVFSI